MVEYNATNVTLKVVSGAALIGGQAASQTPEPSTLLMLGSGLLLLAHYARSRAAGKGSRRSEVQA